MGEEQIKRMQDAGCWMQGQGMRVLTPAPRILHPASIVAPFLAIVLFTAASAMGVEVKLRERVMPKSSVVRLGDVAEIVSADRQQVRQLAAVPLMPAPAPETDRFLSKREVADMLAASGVELGDIHFVGAERVAVAGRSGVQMAAFSEPANSVSGEKVNRHAAILAGQKVAAVVAKAPQLDEAAAAALNEQLHQIVGDHLKMKSGKVTTGRIEFDLTDRQLAQVASATAAPVCEGGSEPWTGRQKFTLSFTTASGTAAVPVLADVAEPAAPIVVAKRAVARGNVITAADVEVQIMEPTAKMTGQRAVLDAVEKVIGKEARQPLQAGEVVFTDQLQSQVLVKKGDLVTVASQSGGIRVRTSARALQDGASGDLVQLESLGSKQRYDARVIGLREATVFAPSKVSASSMPTEYQTARRPFTSIKK
jgi:flagella basal body P-ring formation protein FlgA